MLQIFLLKTSKKCGGIHLDVDYQLPFGESLLLPIIKENGNM